MKLDFQKVWKGIKDHSGTICAGAAVVGVGITAYFSGKGAVEAHETIKPEMSRKEKAKAYFKAYWKAAVSFIVTSGFIFGSDRIHVGKEAMLAGAAALHKDKLLELEKKIEDKFGIETMNEIKKELAEEAIIKNSDVDINDLNLSSEEFVVYVPAAESYYITTEKRMFYALYETNEKLHKNHDVSLGYFCRKLGYPVKKYRDSMEESVHKAMLEDYRWSTDNSEQWYEWETLGGQQIHYINDVYIKNQKFADGKEMPVTYVKTDDGEKTNDVKALFFTVEPIIQRFCD